MDLPKLRKAVQKLAIETVRRHVFLCVGDSCSGGNAGKKAWSALKDELKERGLTSVESADGCFRTKVECLRVCTQGPILVVYPEGNWYSEMTEDRIPEFVERQIIQGQPIEDWIFAKNNLSGIRTPSMGEDSEKPGSR